MPSLTFARYGKDNVRVAHVARDPSTGNHTVTELTVCVLLEGDVDVSYTAADNSPIIATDSIKNTIYIKAKECPIHPPELFATHLGVHFLEKYSHIMAANISVVSHRWTRMVVNGKPHPHSFYRDGEDKRTVDGRISRVQGSDLPVVSLKSGIRGLAVLKSTGSAFYGFVRDEYTTLPETRDRILSTDIDAAWTWTTFSGLSAVEAAQAEGRFDGAWETAREVTMRLFAEDNSASVQSTMYKMAEEILEKVPHVETVGYSLPNKHYFEIDLSWHKDIQNTGKDAEVYVPQSGPNGLIKCDVSRS